MSQAAELARSLREGASSDIFYDAAEHGDEGSVTVINNTQSAMKRAADLLERVDVLIAELKEVVDKDGDLKKMDLSKLLEAMGAIEAFEQQADQPETA